jgi:site-specific DNA recombinase
VSEESHPALEIEEFADVSNSGEILYPKVLGYVRVSTAEQARDGVSLLAQADKIRQFARLHDLDLVDVVDDPGASAKSLDRPGLKAVLTRIAAGEATGLVIAKLDRLTRSVVDLAELVDTFFGGDHPRAQLFSVADSIDTRTAAGRMVLNIIMTIAQWERETIVERTTDAMAHKRKQGEACGHPRFGTMVDPTDPRLSKSQRPVALIPCLEDLDVEVDIRFLRSQGHTMRAIAKSLNDRGIPSKRGVTKRSTGRWSHSSVAEILKRSASGPPIESIE